MSHANNRKPLPEDFDWFRYWIYEETLELDDDGKPRSPIVNMEASPGVPVSDRMTFSGALLVMRYWGYAVRRASWGDCRWIELSRLNATLNECRSGFIGNEARPRMRYGVVTSTYTPTTEDVLAADWEAVWIDKHPRSRRLNEEPADLLEQPEG